MNENKRQKMIALLNLLLSMDFNTSVEISQPLYDITYGGRHLAMTDFLTWTSDAEKVLNDLKQALSNFPLPKATDTPTSLNLLFF